MKIPGHGTGGLGGTWKIRNNEHNEGIEGVDLGCGLRKVGVRVGMNYLKTKPLCIVVGFV